MYLPFIVAVIVGLISIGGLLYIDYRPYREGSLLDQVTYEI